MAWMPERDREPAARRLPMPGWLPDPSEIGVERYWDGARWTHRTRDARTRIEHGEFTARVPVAPVRLRRERRGARPLVVLGLALIIAFAGASVASSAGLLPEWANLGATAYAAATRITKPDGPAVAYPTYGSTELVTYLERSLIAQDRAIDVTYWARTQGIEAVTDALREVHAQNPYVFTAGWSSLDNGGHVSIEPVYLYDAGEADRRRTATLAAVTAGLAASGALAVSDDATRAGLIHDYIASVAHYDTEAYDAINRGEDSPHVNQSQQAYGILVEGTAVCNGYAQAFLAMAEAAGLDAVQVTGVANGGVTTGGHAWNKVRIDGRWLVVDVTWDDEEHRILTDYLMVPDDDPVLASRSADRDWMVDAHLGDFAS